MALLAGPKRKQKIGFDPNNTNWAKDSSAIGQSLLKKMGWKEGAGLGANEDGRIIPVKASMKIDNRGLGCTAQQADAWIAHQEEFDQILASLNDPVKNENNCSASEKRDCSEDKMEDGQRRFYGRFSRGGVKTLRTTEDLNCILGRRKSSSKSEVKIKEEIIVEETNLTGTSGTDSVEEDNSESQDKEAKTDKSHGFVTVTRNCSVQDYFAQKLKNRNLPPVLKMIQDDVEKNDVIVLDKQENNKCKESFQTSSCSVQDYFAQKMKAKQGKLAAKESPDSRSSEEKIEEDCGKENILSTSTLNVEEQSALDIEGENSQNEMKIDNDKKKKKKKKKQTEVSNEVVEDETDKKRKRKRDVDNEDSRTDNKKSKLEDSGKSRREYEDFEETIDVQMKDIDSCETAENKENGKKKKKKSMKNGKNDDVSEESVLSLKKGEDEGKGGKKKEKKSKLKNDKLKNKITNEVVKIVTEIDEDNKNSAIKKDISCSKVGKDLKHGSSEDLTLSKNAKKKKRYQTKKVIIKKLEELRDMDIEKLLKRIQSVGSSVSYDAVIKEIEPKLKDKLAEKVALQKPENCETASSKDKVRKLDKKIKKLKRVALDKASVVNGNVITDIDTVQAAIIKKGKRKEKKNIAVIMQMSKEHNADINWKNEIVILKNARKVAISDIKKEKKEILQDLDKRIVEFTKQIEDIEKKFETRSRGGEQNPSFSGATTTKGYLC